MMTAYIDIYPVKGHVDKEDMKWAVINAGRGLVYKHGIDISLDSENYISGYRIKAFGNDNKMEKFLKNPGRRLRGISGYLLRYWPEKYRSLTAGKRLFNYHLINVEHQEAKMTEELRICTACGKFINSGYCIHDGKEYYCSDKCLLTRYSQEEYDELYKQNEAYWTEWED